MIKKNTILIVVACVIMLAFAIGYSLGNKAVGDTVHIKEKTAYEIIEEGLRRVGE